MSGGGGSDRQITEQEPWKPQQGYLTDIYGQARDLYRNNQTTPYAFDRTAPQSNETLAGQQYQLDFARQIAPGNIDSANSALQRNLNAQDIGNNQYLANAADAALRPVTQNLTDNVLPQIGSSAIKQGAYGGGRQGVLEAQAVEKTNQAVADARAKMYGNAYQQGVNTSLQATNQLGLVNQAGLMPGQITQQIGGQRDAYNQQLIQDAMNRYYENFQFPWQDLANYNANVRGNVGGTTNAPGPQGPSRGQAAMSGAAAGMATGNPWMALGGAVLGGISGG